MKIKDLWPLLKESFSEWSEDKVPRLAAALSYYTLFSLAPLLVIAIGIAGQVLGQQEVQDQVIQQIQTLTGDPNVGDAIQGMIEATRNREANILATVLGLATLLFGAAGLFGQLQDALNTIWEVAPKPGRGVLAVVRDRFLSFTMVLGIGFLLLVSLVITALLSALNEFTVSLITIPGFEVIFQLVNLVISFGVITLLFALIYKILPDVEIAWRDVWLGAAITSLLFSIGKALIGIYLGNSSTASAYGAAGSLVILLLWVYYSAQILFFGAEFTQVYANKFGSRIVPAANAIPLTEEARARQGIPRREALRAAAATGVSAEAAAKGIPKAPVSPPIEQPEILPEAQPSLLVFSAVLAALLGFVSGMVLKKGK